MSWLFGKKLTFFDLICINIATYALFHHWWWTLLLVLLIGGFIAGFMDAHLKHKETTKQFEERVDTNKEWQDLARKGEMIPAIKLYRTMHNCGLKEAVDIVRAYQQGKAPP